MIRVRGKGAPGKGGVVFYPLNPVFSLSLKPAVTLQITRKRKSRIKTKRAGGTPALPRCVGLKPQLSKALELVEQCPAADAQRLGGFGAIVVVFSEGLENGLPLDSFQGVSLGRLHGA